MCAWSPLALCPWGAYTAPWCSRALVKKGIENTFLAPWIAAPAFSAGRPCHPSDFRLLHRGIKTADLSTLSSFECMI